MRRVVNLYFESSCPNVEEARTNIVQAVQISGEAFEVKEIAIQDDNANHAIMGSPTVTVDGKDVEELGSSESGACCRLYKTSSGRFRGAPEVQTIVNALRRADLALTSKQRLARVVAGLGFSFTAYFAVGFMPIAVLLGWFGVSHIVAGVTGYVGCPELGAIPSVLINRHVSTGCGPWRWIDRKLKLNG
jgi:hypothetical protein